MVSDDGVTTRCVCTQLGHFGLLFVSKVAQFCAMQADPMLSSMQPLWLWLDLYDLSTDFLHFRTSTQETCMHLEPSSLQL